MIAAAAPPARGLREALAAVLRDPRERLFVLAFETALLGVPAGPAVAETPARLGETADLLGDLIATGGRVVVLADHPLAEVDRALAPLRLPGCGRGGLELRGFDGATSIGGDPCAAAPSKADALRRLFASAACAGRVPLAFGVSPDDRDTLRVLRAAGGVVIPVGSGPCDDFAIAVPGTDDVRWLIRDFLADAADRRAGGPGADVSRRAPPPGDA